MSHAIYLDSNIKSCQEVRALINDMRELIVAELLVVVNVCLLQHLSPDLLNFFISQLALGQKTGSLQ